MAAGDLMHPQHLSLMSFLCQAGSGEAGLCPAWAAQRRISAAQPRSHPREQPARGVAWRGCLGGLCPLCPRRTTGLCLRRGTAAGGEK